MRMGVKNVHHHSVEVLWMIGQSLAYALRPILVNPKPLTKWQVMNAAFVFGCDYVMFQYFGVWGFLYMVVSSLMGLGLHPAAGHFIAEHYVFAKDMKRIHIWKFELC
eukprot:TRINITY_DN9508_c0_g1_i1.p1 TRINITY_DN9508_c0_g1~~TRINITY_DN9508_c0_g1_i1.p1  ORF type:complete len:107 (-),score=13.71 TRINITY_DN9508_c0_g1_i1:335-655(-)